MLDSLRNWYDGFRGAGDYAITVPPMDGALRPNTKLEQADTLVDWPAPDNILSAGSDVWFSSGNELLKLGADKVPTVEASFDASVTALAEHGGALAIALGSGEIVISGGTYDTLKLSTTEKLPINCPVALAFRDADTLLVGNGSTRHRAAEWRHDLLTQTATGSVWQIDLKTGAAECLARGLGWPCGIALVADGGLLISEAWRSQLILQRPGVAPEQVLTDLPAYPGGIAAAVGGGFWLALFAPRRRLTELVIREPAYRDRMMEEIEPDYWISPSLRPMQSYYEPLQGGTLKKLAMLKPWAPSRSYGLVVRLEADFSPISSYHSRADGTRHGISSCTEVHGKLLVAATGGDVIVSLETGK